MTVKRHSMKPSESQKTYLCMESNNKKSQLVTMDKSVFIERKFPKYATLDDLLAILLRRDILKQQFSC